MIEVGIDWAEDHHDVAVLDEQGWLLASRRIPEGVEGLARLHAVLADYAEDPAQVLVGVETDRGLLVVCDPRMAGMNYGRRLRAALPPMTAVANEAEALAWLQLLNAERA